MPQRPADELLELHESRFSRASPRAASVGSSSPPPPPPPPPPPLRHFRDSAGLVDSRSGGIGRRGGTGGPPQLFCCWLCETPCEGAGWLSASRLYVHSSAPAVPKRNPTRWANGPRGAAMAVPVTRLTLCTRCSAACALPADEPHENVMRRAGATRASAQRSELFVTALREYKLLLEVLAAEVREAHGDTLLAECPARVRSMLLRQLVTTIESTLEVNAFAERTSAAAVLSETERLILDAELQWLEEQISRDKEQVAVGPAASSSLSLLSSSALLSRTRTARRNTTHSSAVGTPCRECRKGPARREDQSDVLMQGKIKSTAATQQRCKASATSKSIQTGGTSIIEAPQTTAVKSPLEDNILLQYFEGRLRDLPPFQLIRRSRGDAVRVAAHPNPNPNVTAELIASKEANARRCEEAEAALRESHQRIAALEKLTDNLSETVLTHRLSATLAEDLGTLHALLHVTADVCAEFTLQKSLLFAEEMAEVVRQTQRHVYGVPKRFAVQSGACLALANRCGGPSEEAKREEEKKKATTTTTTGGAAEKPSLFPASLALKPLVCPSPNE